MKTLKNTAGWMILSLLLVSCYADVVLEEEIIVVELEINANQVLNDYDLWYLNVEASRGNANIPFLQKAFTLSFDAGQLFANNNLATIGVQGGGLGLAVGFYETFGPEIDIIHDLDGVYTFQVIPLDHKRIELYHAPSGAYFVLEGYYTHQFDYDRLFYENIHYFLQEYVAWEKIYTSQEGALNEFDQEHFLQFTPTGNDGNFKSSQDQNGTRIDYLYWDYEGWYTVVPIAGNSSLKTLTLDYDYLGNEFFELSVINANTIALYHVASGTTYHFKGRGYIQYKMAGEGKVREKQKALSNKIETALKEKTLKIS
ncbi:nicotinic acid mononucleotide adenyltransferase [Croceiramulus getboli]|nr:nicotinic acid mononucleotide adenyltransferase [Flavobacteriaceae bacterium YJPT1-3]